MKKLILITVVIMLMSCNAYKSIRVHELSMGMTKKEVFSIITREPLLEYSNEIYEAYKVKKRIVRGGIAEIQYYFLYFKYGKLFKIDKGEKTVDYKMRIDTNQNINVR
jgi:hypothetical protein